MQRPSNGKQRATVFAPGSVGNVGPGFDVLGLAVEGVGDTVTVELTDGEARIEKITGRDAEIIPTDPRKNVASIAATAWLRGQGIAKNTIVTLKKGLAVAGGMGGSGASAVAGAYAAALASGVKTPDMNLIMAAALEAESVIAGRHLDNIAASALGGLTLTLSVDPIDVVSVPVPARWHVALLTPHIRVETKKARAILPQQWDRASWIQQMANTAALVCAFASGDAPLVRRALDDRYAEPLRASLIPNFREVKKAALEAGALGCSISGSGPTIFAIVPHGDQSVGAAMREAMAGVACELQMGPISLRGARRV